MPRHPDFVPHGVIPAVLLPFHTDLSIDEPSFRAHLRDVASVQGLSAITVNAHSTEVASCTVDEQCRVMEIAGSIVGDRLPIIHGVWADGSIEAAAIARRAAEGGAQVASKESRMPNAVSKQLRVLALACLAWSGAQAALAADMNKTLDDSDTPFGTVVKPLDFHRRTLDTRRDTAPGTALQVWALLLTPAEIPFSLVVENYSRDIVSH